MFSRGESVVWRKFVPGVEDQYGNVTPGGFVDSTLPGVAFAPESTKEQAAGGRVISDAKLYTRTPVAFSAQDRFTVRGLAYQAVGDSAGGWLNPFTGRSAGQEILLKRVTG